MGKLDLTKQYKDYYTATKEPQLQTFTEVPYLSIAGIGDPDGKQYADHLQALYSTAYAIKFQYKQLDMDFTVAKLEGLWSFDEKKYAHIGIAEAPLKIPRSEWSYRMLIRLPEFVSPEQVDASIQQVLDKKQLFSAKEVSFHKMTEGKVIQILHTGPFANEPETLQKIQRFAEVHGLQKNGLHHEIYLSDFRKTAPEKLKTILREPVK